MKRESVFGLMFLTVSFMGINAQDVITKMDGSDIFARIFEISANDVYYKKFSNESGPTYTLPKSDVYQIKYENGDVDSWRTLSGKRLSIDLSAPENVASESEPEVVSEVPEEYPAIAIITTNDGKRIKAKILYVDEYEVKYKKAGNESGPVYILQKSDISKIEIENIESFEEEDIEAIKVMPTMPAKPVMPAMKDIEHSVFTSEKGESPTDFEYSFKSPLTAALLSFLYPGAGQFYNGQTGKGIIMSALGAVSLLSLATSGTSVMDTYNRSGKFEEEETVFFTVNCVAYAATWIWSIIDASGSAKAINSRNETFAWRAGNKNRLSLNPEILYPHAIKEVNRYMKPSYGLSLKFNFN
jgi:TM2 domain-containing membrane protein YozV